ncbi:ribonuclease H-like domain-containing protein [Tanacetum coccineum]
MPINIIKYVSEDGDCGVMALFRQIRTRQDLVLKRQDDNGVRVGVCKERLISQQSLCILILRGHGSFCSYVRKGRPISRVLHLPPSSPYPRTKQNRSYPSGRKLNATGQLLLCFYQKNLWEAIKSRFGGNNESKKTQKYILKQQFEGFSEAIKSRFGRNDESKKMHKFLRSLPSAWSQVSLIMRTKPGVDSLSFDDLCPQLDHEDLEQLDEFDLEEIDLKWQVAMISMRMKKFYKKTSRKLQFDAKEPEDSKALVSLDGEGVDWTSHSEDEQENYAFMACNSSGSDTKVTSCSKECKESYAKLKKLYDEQREQLGDASIEIQAYTQALKKVEAQLVAHQQSQLWYEEKIRFMKIDLDDKTDVLTYHKKLLAEAEKEKEDLKAKVEKWHNSSKNLNILLNSQMSARDKAGLGYGDQMNKGVLSYENEVFQSVFVSRTSDIEDSPVNDRYAEGMHAVPPPMTGIYIPSGPDKEIDDSQFTYGPKQSKPSESDARSSDFNTCESNCSEETHESMPEPVVNEPKVVSQPKVWSDAPIIEEYESDSEDEHVSLPTKEQETPSFAFINTVKHVKTPRQTVKEQNTCSQSPKPDKKDCSGLMAEKLGLGYGFTKKACFVCGSFSHLIRDCDFHEKMMVKQVELNNRMSKGSSQRKIRPVWNNVQRLNHQNQFVPKAVLTRTGKIQVNTARTSGTNTVNTARHNFNRQAVPTNAARKVNTVKPIVNNARPKASFNKTLSPFKKPFNRTTTLRTNFSYKKVNTAEDYLQRALQNKGIVDSGCSRHMTGNKAYLAEYQDFNGGPVAFERSKGYIIGKGKIKTGKLDFEDLPDENHVLLRIPRQNNMYSFNLENIVPSGGLACLITKATIVESNKWHRRLGHVNFKNLNKLVKGNFVRGLPSKIFQNDHTCVACQKGKQHKASCKAKSGSSISQPLQLLHMDLFGPTSVRSLNHKTYFLVITDDFSRFSYVFFLRTKDETGEWKSLRIIRHIKNQLNPKSKTIRCYNPVRSENQANKNEGPKEANHSAGTQDNIDAGNSEMEAESTL